MSHPTTADLRRQEDWLRRCIEQLAIRIGERNVYRHEELCEAASFIEQSFVQAAYQPERQQYESRGKTFTNIEPEIAGQEYPEDIIIVGAHYDTERGSAGANDNASGVAALLAIARSMADKRLSRTLRFVAFTNEERPFLRHRQWVAASTPGDAASGQKTSRACSAWKTIGYCSQQRGSQRLSFFGSLYPSRGALYCS
jgi:acetylornithine deacetylase/succinyl-diaminopimelate desuccinylase-like protein